MEELIRNAHRELAAAGAASESAIFHAVASRLPQPGVSPHKLNILRGAVADYWLVFGR